MTMKIFLLIFSFICMNSVSANVHPYFLQYREGQRFILYTHENGKLKIADLLKEDPSMRFNAQTDVDLLLYTRSNPIDPYVLKGLDDKSLSASPYNLGKNTKVISHGWNNNGYSEINTMIRDAFLSKMDVNIIVVDWGKGSNGLYSSAVKNVPLVASWMAKVVNWLIRKGSNISRFHIMGHSLGGHISGQMSRALNGNVPYVTAFDPAGPSWGPGTERIRPQDAKYVEIIHTDAGYLGIKEPVGHNDFYPNEGAGMPGCSPINVGCSHGRSYQYFAESIDHIGFMANQCASVEEALNNKCSNLSKLHLGGTKPKAMLAYYYQTLVDIHTICFHHAYLLF